MNLSKKMEKPKAEISSASMADIAFLLIIFFMVTAVFSATKGLDFKLPSEEQQKGPVEEEEAIYFKVLEDGSFLMDCQPATREDVPGYIVPKLERWPDKPIIIYTRPDAPYRAMVEVYDILIETSKPKDQGGRGLLQKAPNISIPTQTEVKEYERLFGQNPFEKQC
ncbi:MAG: biopolymer transporter ExbD [Acidobacteriota bacterium]|nr:MAG: biopolymer transporter ExbD [Acidobacteriota bacterium]